MLKLRAGLLLVLSRTMQANGADNPDRRSAFKRWATKQCPAALALLVLFSGPAVLAQPSRQEPRQSQGRWGARQEDGRRQRDGNRRPPFQMPLMTALDTDNDGTISMAEMEQANAALKQLDQNNDGALTPDELRPSFGGPDRPERGQSARSRRGRDRSRRPEEASVTEHAAMPKNQVEKKILDVLDDLDKDQRGGMMNVPVEDGRLLRLLTEATGAQHVVEIGTSNGYSGIWLCLALRATGGKLTTYEIDAERAALARKNFQRAGVEKMVTLIEGDAHEEVTKLKEPIGLLFLDADKEGYVDYLEKLLPLVRPGGLILAHNVNPRQADPEYVQAITTNPDLETLFVHKDGAGVSVTLKKR